MSKTTMGPGAALPPKSKEGRREIPELIDVQAVAGRLGVNVRHVRRLVAERRIPYIKWGHLVRFDPEDVAAWLERSRVTDW